jgi:hydrogenase maturation factor
MDDRLMLISRPFRVSAVLLHLENTLACLKEHPLPVTRSQEGASPLTVSTLGLEGACHHRRSQAEGDHVGPAAAEWTLHPAAKSLVAWMRSKGLHLGVFSRHGRNAVERFLRGVRPAFGGPVPVCMACEELLSISLRRNPFRMAARTLPAPIRRTLVVSAERAVLDLAAAAGAFTVLVSKAVAPSGPESCVHLPISDIRQLKNVLRLGIPLPPGKLPNHLLKKFLDEIKLEDPSLLIHPGIGQDIAAVDMAAEEILVLKSDPITFATDAIGQYAVYANANDIATAGATPRWFLTTLLFPAGSTPSMIWSVVRELNEFTRRWGVALCGGHTEITDAVRRPVISGMMAGTVRRGDLIDKRHMRTGDRILLTKAIAVEGTAIIAREFGRRLKALGMRTSEIRSCQAFLDRISILPEAGIAAAVGGTSAMHDVTEGGIATALEELSAAGAFRLRVNLDRIPIFPQTRRLCRLLRIDPFGLIGSGSLLICCPPKAALRLLKALRREGIAVTPIGEVGLPGVGIQALRNGQPARWRSFEVDEVARLFAGSRRP